MAFFFTAFYAFAQPGCKLKINKDSIKVYTCHTDTSRFKSIVTELTVHTTIDQVSAFVMDVPGYTKWQYNTVEAKVIKKFSDSEQTYRTVVEAPWPVTDRDMVAHIWMQMSVDRQQLTITSVSEKGIFPEKEEFVRVPASRAVWTVQQIKPHEVSIRYVMQIDPGGAVPAWLANWVCANAPYLSFKKLKEKLGK